MKNGDTPAGAVVHQNQDGTYHFNLYTGMTKREVFAIQCLQGMISNPETMASSGRSAQKLGEDMVPMVCDIAVYWADKLLESLERER